MPTILDQATLKQRSHRRRHVGRQRVPIRFEADHGAEHVRSILAVECADAGEHLVQDAAERPDVTTLVRLVSLRLFGGHVGCRTENHADARHQRRRRNRRRCGDVGVVGRDFRVRELREAEVQDFHRSVRPKLDVGRLQVAVDDSMVVRRLERLGDLFRDAQCVLERDCAGPQPLREILALDQLHDEGAYVTGFFKAVDIGDVLMVQRCQGLGFACETCDAVRVPREIPQDLDRNVSIEPGVPRAIHLAHAARANQRDDFVRAEASSGRQRHNEPDEWLALIVVKCVPASSSTATCRCLPLSWQRERDVTSRRLRRRV
jgi:hypothetical protein